MNKSLYNLLFFGPQGCGKGTQAKLLSEKFGFIVLGTGELLREIAKTKTDLGSQVDQAVNVEGRLVGPELISQVIEEKIKSLPSDKPIIIDGYLRTLRQYFERAGYPMKSHA